MTIGEADRRIAEIDDLTFKAEAGQLMMSWREYESLNSEAEKLMNLLAERIASLNGCSIEKAYNLRKTVRQADRISRTLKLHCETRPEDALREDPDLIAMNTAEIGTEEWNEAINRFAAKFGYLFENSPKPPVQTARKGLLSRLFRR